MSDILDSIDDILDGETDEDLVSGEILDDSEDFSEDFDLDNIEAPAMDSDEAQEITEAIRASATATYILLAQAHAGKAYKALGYSTWADYVNEEFSISSSRSYQLLDLSKAVKMIEEASPEGTEVKLTEAQARGIKKELPRITEQIKEATKDKSPTEAAEMIDEIIDEAREQRKADEKVTKEKQAKIDEAAEDGYRAGLEAAADAFLEENGGKYDKDDDDDDSSEDYGSSEGGATITAQDSMDIYNFLSVLTGITSLPEPERLLRIIPDERMTEVGNQLDEAVKWFTNFKTVWDEQE